MAKGPGKKPAAAKTGAKAAAGAAHQQRRAGTAAGGRASGATASGGDHLNAAAQLRAAFLTLLPTIGWRDMSFADIVAESGLPMAAAYGAYQTKIGILRGIVRAADQATLESLTSDPLDGTPRDRLFDLIMRRLDQHASHKPAFSALLRDLRRHPADALCLSTRIERSMAMILDLAGLSSSGLRGLLRTKALSGLYLHVFRHWLGDDSADSASTMALLDKRLDQAERLLGMIKRVRRRGATAGEAAATGESASTH